MSRPIREIESDLDDAIKARQAAEKAWDARVVMGNRWDEGWVRAQELDRLKTRVADLSGELRKAQQAALDAALAEPEHIHTCPPDCQKPLCVNRRREIAAAVEAEREACAQVAEAWDADHTDTNYGLCIGNAIRERGSK